MNKVLATNPKLASHSLFKALRKAKPSSPRTSSVSPTIPQDTNLQVITKGINGQAFEEKNNGLEMNAEKMKKNEMEKKYVPMELDPNTLELVERPPEPIVVEDTISEEERKERKLIEFVGGM